MSLITLAEVKALTGLPADTDPFFALALPALVEAVESMLGFPLSPKTRTAYVSGDKFGSDRLILPNPAVRKVCEIRVDTSHPYGETGGFGDDTAWESGTDFVALCDQGGPLSPTSDVVMSIGGAWPIVPGAVKVTFVYGLDEFDVSPALKMAAATTLAQASTRRDGSPVKVSESFGDYSYSSTTRGGGVADMGFDLNDIQAAAVALRNRVVVPSF